VAITSCSLRLRCQPINNAYGSTDQATAGKSYASMIRRQNCIHGHSSSSTPGSDAAEKMKRSTGSRKTEGRDWGETRGTQFSWCPAWSTTSWDNQAFAGVGYVLSLVRRRQCCRPSRALLFWQLFRILSEFDAWFQRKFILYSYSACTFCQLYVSREIIIALARDDNG